MNDQKFYVGVTENGVHLLEKPKRQGYTQDIEKAGVFSTQEAFEMVRWIEGNGCLRWTIPVDLYGKAIEKVRQ